MFLLRRSLDRFFGVWDICCCVLVVLQHCGCGSSPSRCVSRPGFCSQSLLSELFRRRGSSVARRRTSRQNFVNVLCLSLKCPVLSRTMIAWFPVESWQSVPVLLLESGCCCNESKALPGQFCRLWRQLVCSF